MCSWTVAVSRVRVREPPDGSEGDVLLGDGLPGVQQEHPGSRRRQQEVRHRPALPRGPGGWAASRGFFGGVILDLRPTPLWPYWPYIPRLEDDVGCDCTRKRSQRSWSLSRLLSSVFYRIFCSHPRMWLLDLNSLIIRSQSPLRVECFNHVSRPYPRLKSFTVALEVYYLSLLQNIDNFVDSCFEIATRQSNLASIFNQILLYTFGNK